MDSPVRTVRICTRRLPTGLLRNSGDIVRTPDESNSDHNVLKPITFRKCGRMDYLEEFPVLIIDDELHSDTAEGRSSR